MKLPGLIDLSLILILASILKGSEDEKWVINVTRHINATLGSNVNIPCTFTYPDKYKADNVQVYWKKKQRSKFNTFDIDQNAFVFHTNGTFVLEKYRGKTALIGNKDKGNCSLEIRNIMEDEPNIYVRIIARGENFSFIRQFVSISVSGAGVIPVSLYPDSTDTSLPTSETPTMVTTPEPSKNIYMAIFVPVTTLLIIIFVTGIVCCIKHKRSQTLTREESGYYANFSRASSNEAKRETSCQKHDNKKLPEPKAIDDPVYLKAIDDPVYINMEAPPDEMDQSMDHADNIYANVDYSK